MAARTKPTQEFIPADSERLAQEEFGRKMALLETQLPIADEDEVDPDDIALQNVLAELGSSGADIKVNVYQLDEKKNRSFVGSFLPNDFSIELLQAQFGAGDYSVEVRKDKKWLKKTTIKIAAPKSSANTQTIAPSQAIETQKIIETMQGGFNQLGQMFAQALQSFTQNQPRPKTTLESLQEFQLMKEVFGPAQPAQDPMTMITMALELSEKIRPREGEPGTGEIIMKAVENFAPTINQMLAQAQQNRLAPMMQNPIIQAPQIPAPIAQNPEQDEMNLMTKLYAKTLITAANNGAAPETYANNILDLLPEETVLEFISRPDWFGDVVKALPEAAPHAGWFAELKNDILELTKLDEAPSVELDAKIVPETAQPSNAN